MVEVLALEILHKDLMVAEEPELLLPIVAQVVAEALAVLAVMAKVIRAVVV